MKTRTNRMATVGMLAAAFTAGTALMILTGGCSKADNGKATGSGASTSRPGAVTAEQIKASQQKIMASMDKGIDFLRKSQNEDGGWGQQGGEKKESNIGITGLVLEALGKMPADVREKNKDAIESGVKFILANKRADGAIVNKDGMLANYCTSIAARALIAVDKEKYKDVIQAAVNYTKGIQGKDESDPTKFGSIGYGSDKTKGDIINTGEALEMLEQAGVSKDDPVWKDAMVFLGRLQNSDEFQESGVKTANDGGAIYYADRNSKGASKAGTIKLQDGTEVPMSYGGATYNLLKSLLFAGMAKDNPRVKAAYGWIADHYTVDEHPEMKQQGLYYFYYTMARTLELWGDKAIQCGKTTHIWPMELGGKVVSLQKPDGSWVNMQDKWWEGDPTLVTAYTLSTLRICNEMLAK